MPSQLEYHPRMRYWTPVFAIFLAASFSLCASAQANGAPPSVTSFGFGGHPGFNGAPPSVTSLGPRGATAHAGAPHHPQFHQPGTHQHHRQNQGYAYPYYVPYYVPYSPVVDPSDAPEESAADVPEDPNQYQGGPTIFDRRGSGMPAPNDYREEKPRAAVPKPPNPVATPALQTETLNAAPAPTKAPEPIVIAQPSTTLIFKDGHKQEVSNYAIVGSNLFDLTPGHRLKIALSDLDLNATQKANEDEGIDFKLPESPGS
jgi:hypothetical protein